MRSAPHERAVNVPASFHIIVASWEIKWRLTKYGWCRDVRGRRRVWVTLKLARSVERGLLLQILHTLRPQSGRYTIVAVSYQASIYRLQA